MNADAALRAALRANPGAIVAAIDERTTLVAVPASVPADGHPRLESRFVFDQLAVEGQLTILDAWKRAQEESIVRADVRFHSDPRHVATMTVFDVRAEHGVHIIVVEGEDLDAIMQLAAGGSERRPGVAHVKRNTVGTFVEVDDELTAMLGWRADQLVGSSTIDLIHPDDLERAISSWVSLRETPRARVRVRLRDALGRYIWVEVNNESRLDDPDEPCVVSDITDISEEMAHLEALQERERQLARLAEALPIGICHLRPDREVVYTNAPLVRLLGPIASVDDLLAHVAVDDRPSVGHALDRAVAGNSTQHEVGLVDGVRRCELTFGSMINDDGTIDGVIVCVEDVTDRSRLRAELEHRASHDHLTGCLNRAATAAAVERLLLDARRVTVAFIDLDQFKVVNDEIGHAAGDDLLRVATDRLRTVIRDHDLLGRLGGDEFVVVCPGTDTPIDPDELAARLSAALNGEVLLAGRRVVLRASVGAAVSEVGEESSDAVFQRADAAMYTAKRKAHAAYTAN